MNQGIECSSAKASSSAIFMVELRRNEEFIGQDSILEHLSERIDAVNGYHRVALIGLGGIGLVHQFDINCLPY
jgi:hypothetical protein